jgi:hypothetical protein
MSDTDEPFRFAHLDHKEGKGLCLWYSLAREHQRLTPPLIFEGKFIPNDISFQQFLRFVNKSLSALLPPYLVFT